MKKAVILLALTFCFVCGCELSTGYQESYTYSGYSHHWKVARGTTNIPMGYSESPVLDPNDLKAKIMFSYFASEYLKGLKNDLEIIKASADNAAKKAKDISDMVTFSSVYFPSVGSVYSYGVDTNFKGGSYPEFPSLDYIKPTPPISRDEFSYRMYKNDLVDYSATIKSYLEDAEHYVRNAQNDYRMVKKKTEDYISYLEALSKKEIDLDITYD